MKNNLKLRSIRNKNSGITLIALVVTIIVLLILVGIILSMLFGNNNILNQSINARQKTIVGQENESEALNIYENVIAQYSKVEKKKEIVIPEGLKIGSLVTYLPTGSTYKWQGKYATQSTITKVDGVDTTTDDVLLNSKSGGANRITAKWKVFKIDRSTGKVQLVPTETKAKVTLGGAPGYNNAVQLLDAACSALYSDSSKEITARSIDMDDIEPLLNEIKVQTAKDNYRDYNNQSYDEFPNFLDNYNQIKTAYNKDRSFFPRIYEEELNSVINGKKNTSGIELSTPGSKLYERDESTSLDNQTTATTATIGYLKAKTNIKPYETYYYWADALNKSENYKEYESVYSNIFSNKTIWIATRCINVAPISCYFSVRRSFRGTLYNRFMFCSNVDADNYSSSEYLFPVVSLDGDLIVPDGRNFKVE